MEDILQFVPENAHTQLEKLLLSSTVEIKITKRRISKHGDFRKQANGSLLITINKTSNRYRFLITLLHEIAHFEVFKTKPYKVLPHGKEWKIAFKQILIPFLNPQIFPEPLLSLLASHMKNPKASTDRDFKLVMALREYDPSNSKTPVFELEEGQQFELDNGKVFVKSTRRRKRFECKELDSGRIYLFSPNAEVIPV